MAFPEYGRRLPTVNGGGIIGNAMPVLPFSAARFLCLGCREEFDSYPRCLGHRRGSPECKGAAIDILLPEGLLPEVPAGEEEEQEEERAPQERESKEATPAKRPADKAVFETRASTAKETLYIPASIRTMFDAFRARFGYTGEFNDWVLECLADYCFLLGIRIAVVVGTPPSLTPPPVETPKEEAAHAAVG